jgi:hypothetical protein
MDSDKRFVTLGGECKRNPSFAPCRRSGHNLAGLASSTCAFGIGSKLDLTFASHSDNPHIKRIATLPIADQVLS